MEMLDFRLHRSVGRPHRNLSPWIGGGLLAIGGLGAIVAVALTPVRPEPSDGHIAAPAPSASQAGAIELATFSMEPECEPPDADVHDLAKWTIGPHHFGPLVDCRPVTVESVQAMLPNYTVTAAPGVPFLPDEGHAEIIVAAGDTPVLRIETYLHSIEVTVMTPVIATPWGIHVGDRLRDLRAHHPDVECQYGSLDEEEEVSCKRAYDPDGFVDSFHYQLRMADLTSDQHFAISAGTEDEIDLDALGRVRIESIYWSNR